MTRNLTEVLKTQKKKTPKKNLQIAGTLGIPLGGQRVTEVAHRKSFVYVKLRDNQNEIIQAFNNKVAPSYGLPVIVQRIGGRYVVVDVNTVRYQNNWNSFAPFLPSHGNTHSFDPDNSGGGDIVWIHPRQIMPSLIIPSGSLGGPNVLMSSYTLQQSNGTWLYTGNTGTSNLVPYKPNSTGTTLVLIYLDSTTGNPGFLFSTGTYLSPSITGTSQLVPYFPTLISPSTQIPLSVVRLVSGTSSIAWDNIYDVRQWIHPTVTGTSGGGGDDSTYLRLDTNNDPLTGRLDIAPTLTGTGALYAKSVGDSQTVFIQQIGNPGLSVSNPALYIYRGSGSSTPEFNSFAVEIDEDIPQTTNILGGVWKHRMNGVTMFSFNPRGTSTSTLYVFNTFATLNNITGTSGAIASFLNADEDVFQIGSYGVNIPNGYLEFGRGTVEKEVNAGKIGYQLFDSYFDILGAGLVGGSRTVKIYDNLIVQSNVNAGSITIPGITNNLIRADSNGTLTGAETYNASGTYGRKDFGWEQVIPYDGWLFATESWTRTGNHSFAIVGQGDLSANYRKGTKVKYNDPALEFGVVGSVHVTGSNTYVDLITNTDYAMAAATITGRYISYIENPSGFPQWFTWSANPQGFSAQPATPTYQWRADGIEIFIRYVEENAGTSNATTFTATLPIAAVNLVTNVLGTITDNGVVQTTPGRLQIANGSTTVTFRTDMNVGAWTNANGKRAVVYFFYRF